MSDTTIRKCRICKAEPMPNQDLIHDPRCSWVTDQDGVRLTDFETEVVRNGIEHLIEKAMWILTHPDETPSNVFRATINVLPRMVTLLLMLENKGIVVTDWPDEDED